MMQRNRTLRPTGLCPRVMKRAWFRPSSGWRSIALLVGLGLSLVPSEVATASDRTTFLLPLDAETSDGDSNAVGDAEGAMYADELFGEPGHGWRAYMQVWKSHHLEPADAPVRRFLGLPLEKAFAVRAVRGRTSPRWLGWRAGTFAQIDTPHFTIYSRATQEPSLEVAEDLERCYWIWTQMFFPLWEGAPQVSSVLESMDLDGQASEFLSESTARLTVRRKMQVVLFRDAKEYQQTLGPDIPGIERSTGYYNEGKKTTFLYADETVDAETRRHELVHQLFREATRSGLGRRSPGERSGFWLVEGVAGYFESLNVGDRTATVGGWDSPRLQFARYRVLVGGDVMPIAELAADGRDAAQQRQDLARWYAHAIAQTHQLLDGSDPRLRIWAYEKLARLYEIRAELPGDFDEEAVVGLDRSLPIFLRVSDSDLKNNPCRRNLKRVCLAGCEVTGEGLAAITPSDQLQWIDLARLPVGSDAVQTLSPDPRNLEQLTLEVTRIDDQLLPWLGRAGKLRELDLSWTKLGDDAIASIAGARNLATLWMTGSQVSDESIDAIISMRELDSVDLQRTKVSPEGLQRLRAARADLNINPLELRAQ